MKRKWRDHIEREEQKTPPPQKKKEKEKETNENPAPLITHIKHRRKGAVPSGERDRKGTAGITQECVGRAEFCSTDGEK